MKQNDTKTAKSIDFNNGKTQNVDVALSELVEKIIFDVQDFFVGPNQEKLKSELREVLQSHLALDPGLQQRITQIRAKQQTTYQENE